VPVFLVEASGDSFPDSLEGFLVHSEGIGEFFVVVGEWAVYPFGVEEEEVGSVILE
jgi:hypothetical protein